jgi:uncharacterized membrane protein HdeD (DUF308 family)
VRILGLIVIIVGWLIAVSSTQVPGTTAQLLVVVLGFLISAVGILGILNRAHLKHAIWKGESARR